MNLVGPGSLDPHYQDCTLAVEDLSPEGRWVDLGSGAGFPGVVFTHLFPQVSLDLVDSRKKRCAFLEHVLAIASIPPTQAKVLCVRAEDLQPHYDGLLSRAFAPPEECLDHAHRLLRPGGQVVLFLQDQEPPEDPRFCWLSSKRYKVEGRWRRAVLGQKQ